MNNDHYHILKRHEFFMGIRMNSLQFELFEVSFQEILSTLTVQEIAVPLAETRVNSQL